MRRAYAGRGGGESGCWLGVAGGRSAARLCGLVARNRVVVSPMSQYLAADGAPTDWHLVHLGKFAMGGAGIVFVEETSIERAARM